MLGSIYIGLSGLSAYSKGLQTISNNVTNLNTPGFKATSFNFADSFSFGGLGLAIAVAHARWRGPRDPSRWHVEHLTSLLGAYTIGWSFILALYAGLQTATGLVVPVVGLAAIVWARRHFGSSHGSPRTAEGLTGAA